MRLLLLILFAILFIASSISAQSDTTHSLAHYYNQGTQAYQSGDFKTFRNSYFEANKIRPTNPVIIYNLACGYALTGESDAALDLLEKLAEKGIDFGVEQDSDFDSIKNSERFNLIVNKLNRIRKTINNSEIAFTVKEKDLIPEGIAYDPISKRIFLSSIYKRKIISIDENGNFNNFTDEKQDGLYATLGMEVDPVRNNLWVCTAAAKNMKDYTSADSGKSTIHKYDLSGKLLKIFHSPKNEDHEFNDLVINSSGDVYCTDSRTGQIFFIHHIRDSLELLFDEGLFIGSNGITLSSDEKILFIAAYSEGVYSVNLNDLSHQLITTPDNCTMYGIDGLYFHDNSLIAVQNGLRPNRIARYVLDKNLNSITKCEIIEMNNELFNEPTTGVVVRDKFYYIANSQLSSFDREGHIFPIDKLKDVTILKIEL